MPSVIKGGALMAAGLAPLLLAGAAAADQMVGAPEPWGLGLQAAGGVLKERIHDLNQLVFWIIVGITVFVGALLAFVILRYNAARNPVPSTTSHNTTLEIVWTVIPVLILIVIAIPSFRLVYYQDRTREADLTVQVIGRQWYWTYAYPDHGGFSFDSRPVPDEELRPGQLRNLSVDEPLVVPVGANVRVLTSGVDVIHSFFVPSLGVQRYTIPGRTLETWFRADRPGVYYGQCNQICGVNHWFMPIEVRAVPREEFDRWVADARRRFAHTMPDPQGAPALAAPSAAPITLADAR
ncbi:MAG: cytochrome c oxidase subunit II [Rhodovarius sp.]|nr:cytochrome c oxidase subunit II [Rhodovarius sp.]MCX7932756.1 cytochrome c oxidase subunit II [Rhodovarius sp.]MDW8315623.1 cytochrome c oxidase subunit II [Rhodovarius sp.]